MIEENILEETLLAKKMIIEFLENQCYEFVTKEHSDILKDLLEKTKVSYGNIESNGKANWEIKEITIKETIALNTERVISYLIHEYAHIFVNRNYNKHFAALDKTFNEGIADTFSDLVVNHYFNKHKNVECKGRKLNFKLPYDSYSCYLFQNSWVRSMLYPLEKDNNDKKALIEILFGNPLKFFELTMGKDFSDSLPVNDFGFPTEITIRYKQLYEQNKEIYSNIDKKSIYYRRNFILPAFILQNKIEPLNCEPIYSLGDRKYNEYFIAYNYFESKKIYEIDSIKISEFVELYHKARSPEKTFFEGYYKFLDLKAQELTKEEIKENSYMILKNFSITFEDINNIGTKLEVVLLECINNEFNKIKNKEVDEVYIQKLYKILYDGLANKLKNSEKDSAKNITEIINNHKSLFKENIITIEDYIKKSENIESQNKGTSKICYEFDNFVLLESNYPILENELLETELLEKINKMNINSYQILNYQSHNNKYYLLETKVSGTPIQQYNFNTGDNPDENYKNEKEYVKAYLDRLKELSENYNHLKKFATDYFKLHEIGAFIDSSKTTNFYHDKEKGVSFIDLKFDGSKYDEKYIFNCIMYVIGWCYSNNFTEEEIELEERYLKSILNQLKEICIEIGKDPNTHFVRYNGEPLDNLAATRKLYRQEYGTEQEVKKLK